MLLVGLTGGIGAGKSTFAVLLAERGAQVIDADLIARDILKPDEPAWHSVVDQFGDEILVPGTMEVDRSRLAAQVFSDPQKLAALNAIVHPVIVARVADELEKLRRTDAVVVLDAALIVEIGLVDALDVLVVVTAPEDVRRARLMRGRGMHEADAAARMRAQAADEKVRSAADIVVENAGSLEDLAREADRVWAELERRRP